MRHSWAMEQSLAPEQGVAFNGALELERRGLSVWGEAMRIAGSLVKYRLVMLIILTMFSSAEIATHGAIPGRTLAQVLVGGALAAAGAAALNHYFDRDIDARMRRTRTRPLPSGVLSPRAVLSIGVALLCVALPLSLLASPVAAVWIGLAAFTYVVVYTCWLKRRTPNAVVVGSLTGSWAVLAGWCAVQPHLGPMALLLAALVFTWTPAHFWAFAVANAADYRCAGIPTLPNVTGAQNAARAAGVYALWTAVLAVLPAVWMAPGGVYAAVVVVVGGLWLRLMWRLWRQPTVGAGYAAFHASNAYLAVVFLALLFAAKY